MPIIFLDLTVIVLGFVRASFLQNLENLGHLLLTAPCISPPKSGRSVELFSPFVQSISSPLCHNHGYAAHLRHVGKTKVICG